MCDVGRKVTHLSLEMVSGFSVHRWVIGRQPVGYIAVTGWKID